MTDVTIAPADPADAGEILTVQRAAYLVEAQRYRDVFLPPLTESLEAAESADTLIVPNRPDVEVPRRAAVLDAIRRAHVRGARLVGSVRARVDGDTAHVGRLSVAPDQQGRGVGGRLLDAVERACAGRVARFALFTGADSAANLALYARRGYQVVAHRPDENGNRLAVLEKTVSPARSGA